MTIYSVFIINKAGSLIYFLEVTSSKVEVEKTFSYPLELTLKLFDDRVVVAFGQRDGIRVGHAILAINGDNVAGKVVERTSQNVLELVSNPDNFPLSIKFGRPKLSTNERIMLASMFHSLFAIGCSLSPASNSSGIESIEADTFKLNCFQSLTGLKFCVVSDPRRANLDALLRKIYELYSDFALKNPFYSLDMPIRCELFDQNMQQTLEVEKSREPGTQQRPP